MNFRPSRILITGATGSLGKVLIKRLLTTVDYQVERLVVYSRDELKQWELSQEFPESKYPCMRCFLGDIRDYDRLITALEGIDTVIHCAALKQVPASEYNPMEFVKTNVIGTQNVVNGCLSTNVKLLVSLSTDKASAPINLYGATKLCADKLVISANNIKGFRQFRSSVVRYGNVMGSRGSVIPYFMNNRSKKVLPITDPTMTRFNITLNQGADLVLWALENSKGSELFVPKIPSYKITDVAEAISPSCEKKIVGIRPGEKIHEEMINASDSINTIDIGKYYVVLPPTKDLSDIILEKYKEEKLIKNIVKDGFSYSSGTNTDFLTVENIRQLIRENLYPDFEPL